MRQKKKRHQHPLHFYPHSAVKLEAVRYAIGLCHAFEVQTPEAVVEPLKLLCCPDCGGELEYRCSVLPFEMPPVRDTG